MYKLLVVDDEPLIVDWLYRLFGGLTQYELDLYKAYTGEQAMDWLNRTKIDIVLTDIHMPEMNGIQLLENIKRRWPDCKVIFLTGYNEFEYVYTAIQYEGVQYLLKTEDDSEIVKAVEKNIRDIEMSYSNAELIGKAKQQVVKALPLLQREYLTMLVRGEKSVFPIGQQQLNELEIQLNAESPILMLVSRLDTLPGKHAPAEKYRLVYTVKNVVEKYLFWKVRTAFLFFEEAYPVWLLQPADADTEFPMARMSLFVKETLESARRACLESLGVNLSFALPRELMDWESVSDQFYGLKRLLYGRFASNSGLILMDNDGGFEKEDGDRPIGGIQIYLNRIGMLESCLERGMKHDFFELFDEVADYLANIRSKHSAAGLELYLSVSLKLLSHINRRGLADRQEFQEEIGKLTRVEAFGSWADAAEFLQRLARELFLLEENEQEKREKDTIIRVQQYISEHLAEDVSLVKLGELTYFNPSYLSRLFKQITGTNISNHILQARLNKAKEYLGASPMKIHEIAALIGFDSPAYFSKFFKKYTNMTPQEYRDAYMKR